jgi:hypothetical protein
MKQTVRRCSGQPPSAMSHAEWDVASRHLHEDAELILFLRMMGQK